VLSGGEVRKARKTRSRCRCRGRKKILIEKTDWEPVEWNYHTSKREKTAGCVGKN
jgi:hypothetical protein